MRRAWSQTGYADLFVRFRPAKHGSRGLAADSVELADLVGQAVIATNDAHEAAVAAGEHPDAPPEEGSGVFGESPIPTPTGPVVLLSSTSTSEETRAWLDDLARRLSREGLTGRLTPARPEHLPSWAADSRPPHDKQLVALIGVATLPVEQLPGDDWRRRWWVDPDTTTRIADWAVTWPTAGASVATGTTGSDLYLSREVFRTRTSIDAARTQLTAALASRTAQSSVVFLRDPQHWLARTSFFNLGTIAISLRDDPLDWARRLDGLLAALRALHDLPAPIDLAGIRWGNPILTHWTRPGSAVVNPPAPLIEHPGLFPRWRPLWRTHVLDAYGAQILTTRHLERAHDLSNWRIEDWGRDTHLVTAHDLAPWYATTQPPHDVLVQARHDFGDLVVTDATLAAHPALP